MQILIIDDDIETSDLLTAFLEQSGNQVRKSYTAQDGLAAFRSAPPEIVFVDIMLPDKSGLEVLQEIKRSGSTVPVIMVTGFKDAENVVNAFRQGAYDCLLKPFNYEYLKQEILEKIPLYLKGKR